MCCTWNGFENWQGKRAAEPSPNANPNTSSIGIVPPSEGEDSAASFLSPNVLTRERPDQPTAKAKLMRIPTVDSDIEHQLVARGSNSSSSSSSNSSSASSSSNSSDSSSEGPSCTDSDNGGQDVFGGSTVSATDSDLSTSSGSNTKTPSGSKKYRRVAVHIGKDVVDVDAMSSDACLLCMLSDGEYNVHISS